MKKCMLIALIMIFTLSVLGTFCCAQLDRTVTDTSKKGSLLIWPLVKGSPGQTIIKLSNDYYLGVKVKCVYRYPFPCQHAEWFFTLSANQQVTWSASTGKGVGQNYLNAIGTPPPLNPGVAELRCWAIDDNETKGQQIAWNWLAGGAIVKEPTAKAWEYSAWRFAVNSSTTGARAGEAGKIRLTGDSGNYDACPTALMFNFLKQTPSTSVSFPSGTVDNVLTLVPCGADFVDNNNTIVYTELPTRDENGNSSPGTSVCVGCGNAATQWFSESLLSSKLHLPGPNPFVNLATPGGSFTVHGKQNSASCPSSKGIPLLGVMSMQFCYDSGVHAGGPQPTLACSGIFAGDTPTALGPGQAYLKDADDNYTSTPVTITWH
jgi:hypothetical protein